MSTLHWVVLMVATAQSHVAGMGSGSAMVGWCRPDQACWPSPADIIKLGLSLAGTVVTRDAPSFDDLCHVKNLRFNATRPGMVVSQRCGASVHHSRQSGVSTPFGVHTLLPSRVQRHRPSSSYADLRTQLPASLGPEVLRGACSDAV